MARGLRSTVPFLLSSFLAFGCSGDEGDDFQDSWDEEADDGDGGDDGDKNDDDGDDDGNDSANDGDGSGGEGDDEDANPYAGGWPIGMCQDDVDTSNPNVVPDFMALEAHGDTLRLYDFCDRVVKINVAGLG